MKCLKVLMFALALSFAASAQVVDTNSQHFYLFTYFMNANDQAGARMAVSSDAINWQKINNEQPVIVPTLSNEHRMRDPYTCYDPRSGVFHLVWTTGWTQQNIGYAAVKDLRTWENAVQVALPVSSKIPNCACTWAPEIFFDAAKDSFMIYWSTERGTNGKRIYYCMTKDFKSVSDPILFFDPGYSVIDADILKADSVRYYMFFKDERTPQEAGKPSKNLHYVYGTAPQGPWTPAAGSSAITSPGCEGPSAIKIGSEYWIYFDPYFDFSSTYRLLKVTDLATTTFPWPQGDVLKTASGNFLFSHGHIIEIPRVKVMELLYNITDPTVYDSTWVLPTNPALDANKYPLGKQNCGCGTGVGLAFIPPLWFKAMANRKRKKKIR
jgi:hypothetical protein